MTNPTSNFGWQMPTPTDLVTDLPADFEVFGQAVDTSLADLKGGTTGQVLKKNSNTDMDFVWSADAAGMTNPMTTTGDTIYSSSGSTPARLGIGTAGQFLKVNSGATAPEWATLSAGGMTLISTTTFSNTSSLSLTSIPQTYKHLYLTFQNMKMATGNAGLTISDFGGSAASATWLGRRYDGNTYTTAQYNFTSFGYISGSSLFGVVHGTDSTNTRELGFGELSLPNYTNSQAKFGFSKCAWVDGASGNWRSSEIWANTGTTAAITSIDFGFSANVTSGTLLLYGVS